MSPDLLALLYRQRNLQRGDDPLPDVTVAVFQVGPADDFAAAVAAVKGTYSGDGIWTIPAAGLHSIPQYPELITAETSPAPTPATGDERLGQIAEAVIAHEAGVPATQAAKYVLLQEGTLIGVEISAPDPATEGQVRSWPTSTNVAVPADERLENSGFWMMVPVDQVRPLLNAYLGVSVDGMPLTSQGLPMNRARRSADALTNAAATVNSL